MKKSNQDMGKENDQEALKKLHSGVDDIVVNGDGRTSVWEVLFSLEDVRWTVVGRGVIQESLLEGLPVIQGIMNSFS